ncbi:hypothetical protein BpHYR1_000652 [Brachionus plicatilis]|uniref:Uncharacterized protein n=1 Tax=Brachionus plicatilis TaxID=10195 RepID=A0A3M7SHG9_BRAPC|nr:hypothetical protein BpHYR1_000652 [Brachionus plicatilis]
MDIFNFSSVNRLISVNFSVKHLTPHKCQNIMIFKLAILLQKYPGSKTTSGDSVQNTSVCVVSSLY